MDEQKRRYHFILSTFSRNYGVKGVTDSMRKFSKYISESDFEISGKHSLDEFDSIIINKFKTYGQNS